MWLLKIHLSISILCLLTCIGFGYVFKEQILKNGYVSKKKNISKYIMFFIPLLNLFVVLTMFIMISVKKEDFDNWCEEQKKDKEA